MKILFYREFSQTEELKSYIEKLENGDFSQAKKLTNSEYFRLKTDRKGRILFTFRKYKNKTYLLILEYLPNHEYEKSKFLNGRKVDESDFIFPETIEEFIYLNPKQTIRKFENRLITFSDIQENVLKSEPPIILIGSAGSGKTSILIEKIREGNQKILYISLSKYLIEQVKTISEFSANVDFFTFSELFQIKNEITFDIFQKFAKKHKIKEFEKYFEEFRGVLTGAFNKKYLSKSEYLHLGERESLFLNNEKERVYTFFEKYLNFLLTEKISDSNIFISEKKQKYDLILIDEIQDFTNSQIFNILNLGKDFILSGDSNQIIYSNFFSWSKLKEMLFFNSSKEKITIIHDNFRNSQKIVEISNRLLKLKQKRFGSIDRESNYLLKSSSTFQGKIHFWNNLEIITEINNKRKNDVTFAILVFDEKTKKEAERKFETPLIFTIREAKGLEYDNILLYNFISYNQLKFSEIVDDIQNSDLDSEDLKYSRPKNRTDRELDIYKIYINSLYVALTRTMKNLYIIEKEEHKLWELLNVVKSEISVIEQKVSENKDWTKETKRLKLFGKTEQITKIEKKIKERLSTEEYFDKLKTEVFQNGNITKNKIIRLIKIATELNDTQSIEKAKNLKLSVSSQKNHSVVTSSKELRLLFNKAMKRLTIFNIKNYLNQGGDINRGDKLKQTFLMFASNLKQLDIAQFLLQQGANPNLQNDKGATALNIASNNGYIGIIKLLLENGANPNFQNNDGWTVLFIASNNGDTKVVQILLEYGANPNLQNNNKGTALMYATQNGYIDIVILLLKNGANPNLQNNNKGTALGVAIDKGHSEIIKILKQVGAE